MLYYKTKSFDYTNRSIDDKSFQVFQKILNFYTRKMSNAKFIIQFIIKVSHKNKSNHKFLGKEIVK